MGRTSPGRESIYPVGSSILKEEEVPQEIPYPGQCFVSTAGFRLHLLLDVRARGCIEAETTAKHFGAGDPERRMRRSRHHPSREMNGYC